MMSDVVTTQTKAMVHTLVTATNRKVTYLHHAGPLLLPLHLGHQKILVNGDFAPHQHFDDLYLRIDLSCMAPPALGKTRS